jgi:hypothetical protein
MDHGHLWRQIFRTEQPRPATSQGESCSQKGRPAETGSKGAGRDIHRWPKAGREPAANEVKGIEPAFIANGCTVTVTQYMSTWNFEDEVTLSILPQIEHLQSVAGCVGQGGYNG